MKGALRSATPTASSPEGKEPDPVLSAPARSFQEPELLLKTEDASVISTEVLTVFLNINHVYLVSEVCWRGGEAEHHRKQSAGSGSKTS